MTPGARRALAYAGGIMLLAPALLWVVGRTFFTVGVPAAWLPALLVAAAAWLLSGLALIVASRRRGRDRRG